MKHLYLVIVIISAACIPGYASAETFSCPPMPKAVSTVTRDFKTDIKASVASLGRLKAGEIEVKSEIAAQNLLNKHPSIDKLFIIQTMSATYCEMLRSSKSLTDSERLRRWEIFQSKILNLKPDSSNKKTKQEKIALNQAADRSDSRVDQTSSNSPGSVQAGRDIIFNVTTQPDQHASEHNLEKVIEASIKKTLDEKIREYDASLKYKLNLLNVIVIDDKSINDGGKISTLVHWKDGPIIDIGNENDKYRNRILLSVKYPNQVYLIIYDVLGKKYQLEGNITNLDQGVQLECIWSSKDKFIAIISNGSIIAKVELPELMIFQNTGKQRKILIAGSFEHDHGTGNIRDIYISTAKEISSL